MNIPAAVLREELRWCDQRASALVRRYERLMQRAAALRAEIEAAGGAIHGSSVARKRNEASLVETLATALAGKTLSVDEATQAVLAAGYPSTSPEFRKIVNITLSRSGRFERVERGRYTATWSEKTFSVRPGAPSALNLSRRSSAASSS